jgi:periplasmic protein TonB
MKHFIRHGVALCSMLAGSVGVFGLIYWLNADELPPKLETEREAVAFEVDRKPPPKREKQKRERPAPKRDVSTTPRAPLPNLSATLAGASFDLPSFENAGLEHVDEALLGDTSKRMVMAEGAMDTPPQPVRRNSPKFPEKARRGGVEGFVKMTVFVNQNGTVDQVKVLDASPSGVFEQVAQDAIRTWEFEPGVYQGESVAGWVTQTIRFELKRAS